MPLTKREIHGLRIEILGDTGGIRVHPGRCRDFDDQRDIGVDARDTCLISPGQIGLGGLDTGTVMPNTCYAVYLVRQGNDTEGMISKAFDPSSADPPAFPNDGSLAYRRIGAVVTDAKGRVIPAQQEGDDEHRRYIYKAEPRMLTVLREGMAVELTPFDLAPFLHRHATRAQISIQPGQGVAVNVARAPCGTGAKLFKTSATLDFDVMEGDKPTMGYYQNATAGGSTTITVLGFEETL